MPFDNSRANEGPPTDEALALLKFSYDNRSVAQSILEKTTLLQSTPLESDRFVAPLSVSKYRRTCKTAGKSGKQIERCVISTFRIAESMGFKGDSRQWEHLLALPCAPALQLICNQ